MQMDTGSRPIGQDDTALREAAEWLARLTSDRAGPQDKDAFQLWHDASDANAEAWRLTNGLWADLGDLAEDPEFRELRDRTRPAGRSAFRQFGAAFAVAASLVLTIGGALAIWSQGGLGLGEPAAPAVAENEYRTAVGEIRRVVLADGSMVTLDTDSTARVRFDGSTRRIQLTRGRAHFEVAHDRAHPFVVEAAGRSVTALGTVFDVRLQPDRLSVVLTQGSVRVADLERASRQPAVTLTPGQQLVAPTSGQWRAGPADLARASTWTDGRLTFDGQPLQQVVDEMNRYSARKFRIADARLGATPIGGVFRVGDVQTFALALEASHVGKVQAQPNGTLLISAP